MHYVGLLWSIMDMCGERRSTEAQGHSFLLGVDHSVLYLMKIPTMIFSPAVPLCNCKTASILGEDCVGSLSWWCDGWFVSPSFSLYSPFTLPFFLSFLFNPQKLGHKTLVIFFSHRQQPAPAAGVVLKSRMAELLDTDPQPLVYWDRKQFTHFSDQVKILWLWRGELDDDDDDDGWWWWWVIMWLLEDDIEYKLTSA